MSAIRAVTPPLGTQHLIAHVVGRMSCTAYLCRWAPTDCGGMYVVISLGARFCHFTMLLSPYNAATGDEVVTTEHVHHQG